MGARRRTAAASAGAVGSVGGAGVESSVGAGGCGADGGASATDGPSEVVRSGSGLVVVGVVEVLARRVRADELVVGLDDLLGGEARRLRTSSPVAVSIASSACSRLSRRRVRRRSCASAAASVRSRAGVGRGPVGRGVSAASTAACARCTMVCMFTRAMPSALAASLMLLRPPSAAVTSSNRVVSSAGTATLPW
jgi:hypothetical protein